MFTSTPMSTNGPKSWSRRAKPASSVTTARNIHCTITNAWRRSCTGCAPSNPPRKSPCSGGPARSPKRASAGCAGSSGRESTKWRWRRSSPTNSSAAAAVRLRTQSSPAAKTPARCTTSQNDQPCRKGELLLLDVAASYANYNADLTRTIPVNGRFTRRQKQVYNAVLRVLRAASAAATPGKLPQDWQKEAEDFIEKELVDLGLLETCRKSAGKTRTHPRFKQILHARHRPPAGAGRP